MVFTVTRTEDVFKEDKIFIQLWPWIVEIKSATREARRNVIPVDSQDLKWKREQEHTGLEFQSWHVFHLRPFLEHPSPFWHFAWERACVSMVLEGSVWTCVPSSLSRLT